ncbi:hypothetical protein AB0L65_22405 [Nonomuraea sp. NPDC052116]|uniref:hypothetical protein n=1 Tax=Nonomuraea sp. NPDC052116 TaxID=3155665 RepID=UPI00342DF041
MRRRRPALHIAGLGASYIALPTGFYLDNGPHLPLWERLPGWSHGALPSLVGVPLITLALWRRRPTRTPKKVTS